MSEHTIQEIGYRSESTFDTSAITAELEPIHFGTYAKSWGNYSEHTHEIVQKWAGIGKDPVITRVAKSMTQGQIAYIPTDSLMWAHTLGTVVSDGLGKQTITGTDGTLPSYSIREESSNVTNVIREEVTGVRNKTHSFVFDMREPDNLYAENVNYLARQLLPQTSIAVDDRIEPIYADTNTLVNQNEYIRDSNFEIKWDTLGDNVPMEDYFLDMTYLVDNGIRHRWVQGLKYPKLVSTGKRTHALGFNLRRTDDFSIYDDFKAQIADDTFKNMSFTIYNSATKYKKFTWSNVSIKLLKRNHALLNRGETPKFDAQAFAESVTIETNDGVTDALYAAV